MTTEEDDPVTFYAHLVADGELPAGQWHKAACARHLADIQASEAGTCPFEWRAERASKFLRFTRLLRHYKGEWGGRRIVLQRWQQFVLGSLFGWVHKSTGLRRFRNAFIELPRGQGKSTMVAAVLVFGTFFENEPGADGFVVATKQDQARIVFNAARQMVLRSKAVRRHIKVSRYNLHSDTSESHAQPLGANKDTMDGLRPHIAIADEVHKHSSPDLIGVIEAGMGTRRQPLLIEITTAGEDDDTTVYGQHYRISTQVLDGSLDVPEWFAFIAHADAADDWRLESTWIKANPNYNVSVKPEYMQKAARLAEASTERQVSFRRVHLGQRVEDLDGTYFSREAWDACPQMPDEETLRSAPCWIGLDLSSRVDLTAAVLVWRLPTGIAVRPWFWVPEQNLDDRGSRDRVPYRAWADHGYIIPTEGATIDLRAVRRMVNEIAAKWSPQEICFDPWHAGEMTQAMQDEDGLLMVEVPQRYSELSEPTKRFQALMLERLVAHDRHPIMRWMVGNAKTRSDDRENVLLCKKRSRGRIDGLAATVTALARIHLDSPDYNTKELFVI